MNPWVGKTTPHPGERSGNLLQDSRLGNPTDSGAWQTTVHRGHKRVRHNLATKQQTTTRAHPPRDILFICLLVSLLLERTLHEAHPSRDILIICLLVSLLLQCMLHEAHPPWDTLIICLLVSLLLECTLHEGKDHICLLHRSSRHLEKSWYLTCSLSKYLLDRTCKMGCSED